MISLDHQGFEEVGGKQIKRELIMFNLMVETLHRNLASAFQMTQLGKSCELVISFEKRRSQTNVKKSTFLQIWHFCIFVLFTFVERNFSVHESRNYPIGKSEIRKIRIFDMCKMYYEIYQSLFPTDRRYQILIATNWIAYLQPLFLRE